MRLKALLSAATVLLLPMSSLAGPPAHECQKDCPHKHAADSARPISATPRAEAPSRGAATAPVTIEVWSDFQCPYCVRGAARMEELRAKYGDQVRFVFRNQPLPFHKKARLAAAAAMAAHEQGKFWEYHDTLFANQDALDREALESYAQKLGLDLVRFRKALDTKAWDNYVEADVVEAQRRGIAGTPTFFINGKPVTGAQPLETFTQFVDAELKR